MLGKMLFTALVGILISCDSEIISQESNPIQIKKGTNVAHWLSQTKKRGIERVTFFTENDVKRIAQMGFDHIRLPVDEEHLWDESGQKNMETFKLLHNGISWCIKYNLKVVLDLHILRSHHFNANVKPLWTDPEEQQKFIRLWEDLSAECIKYPNEVLAYEMMNEAVADDPEDWNKLLKKCYDEIRNLEPYRSIIIGSNMWQSADTFDVLKIPENDPNIVLSFHFYEPFLLTHYQAGWTDLKDYQGPVTYPGVALSQDQFDAVQFGDKEGAKRFIGKVFDKNSILEMWKKPIELSKKMNLALYCGEFGVISNAPENERINWHKDIVNLFIENNIAYANWNYRSNDFGLINNYIENQELIKIITHQ